MKIEFNIKGTEKQIAWCKKILKDFNLFFETLEDRELFKKYMKEDYEYFKSNQITYQVIKEVVQRINNENASYIIENRELFERNFSLHEIHYIRKCNKMINKYVAENNIKGYSSRLLCTIANCYFDKI